MVSRDSTVHAAVMALTVVGFAVLNALADLEQPAVQVVVFVVFYGLVLGGSHLVLAVRGEDGIVPISSRWRFLGTVAVVLAAGSVALATDPVRMGPVTSDAVLAALVLGVVVGYWILEARDGYREATESTTAK